MQKLQSDAQKKGLGIWSIENYAKNTGFNPPNGKEDLQSEKGTSANCSNPLIKGNISSRKEKIYHVPSGQHYKITKPEQWFCTEKEALETGFRKSKS